MNKTKSIRYDNYVIISYPGIFVVATECYMDNNILLELTVNKFTDPRYKVLKYFRRPNKQWVAILPTELSTFRVILNE